MPDNIPILEGWTLGGTLLYCDRIDDSRLARAAVKALVLMRGGMNPPFANTEAASDLKVSREDVAHLTGQHAARIRAYRSAIRRAARRIA